MAEEGASPCPVVNASPLIFLSKSGYLNLLQAVGEQILVPDPVAQEIRRRGPGDITARALEETSWLQVAQAAAVPAIVDPDSPGLNPSSLWIYL